MKKVSEFIRSIHMYTGSSWFNMVSHWESMLHAINFALTQIYFRKTRLRYWQLKSERFEMRGRWDTYSLVTKHPIIKIAWIFDAEFNPISNVKVNTSCETSCNPEEPSCWCDECWVCTSYECDVCIPRWKIIASEVAPWTYLEPWRYSIAWWSGWWWTFGNVIAYKPTTCKQEHAVYVLYYAWFNELKCVEDTINIPHFYLAPLAYLVTGFTIARFWNYRVWDDKFYLTEGLSLLDEIDSYNNHAPSLIAWK